MKYSFLITLCCAVIFLLGGCLLIKQDSEKGSGEINGKLVRDDNGEVVKGATVFLIPLDVDTSLAKIGNNLVTQKGKNPPILETKSEESGRYYFTEMPMGRYSLLALFETNEESLSVFVPEIDYKDTTSVLDMGDQIMKISGGLTVKIKKENDSTLDSVTCKIEELNLETISTENDECEFKALPEGTYTVTYEHYQYNIDPDSGVKIHSDSLEKKESEKGTAKLGPYNLEIFSDSGGRLSITDTLLQFDEELEISVQIDTGYLFFKWETDSGDVIILSGDRETAVKVSLKSHSQIRAKIIKRIKLTLDSNDHGTVSPVGVHYIKKDSGTYITARPDSGWKFHRWVLDGEGASLEHPDSNQTLLTVTRDVIVKPEFIKIPDDLLLVPGQGGKIVSDTSFKLLPEDTVVVKAESDSGWLFSHWTIVSGVVQLEDSTSMETRVSIGSRSEIKPVFELYIVICPPGSFGNAQQICIPAPPGKFVADSGQNQAEECNSGYYQPDPGQTSCRIVGPGHYSNSPGSSVSYPCLPGTFQSDSGQTSCIQSNPGYFVSDSGSTSQMVCLPGTFQSDSGFEICKSAPRGSYVPDSGSVTSILCPVGNYQPMEGQSSCIRSLPGHFIARLGADSSATCSPGFYQPDSGQTNCIKTDPGHYTSDPGSSEQLACRTGTYQPVSTAIRCLDAQRGFFVPDTAQTSATLCLAGTYSSAPGQTNCILAGKGRYVNQDTATSSLLCAAGFFQPNEGQTSCLKTTPGHFADQSGTADQKPCAQGTYQPDSLQINCLQTPVGTAADTGQASYTICTSGYFQNNMGQSQCIPAPAGRFVAGDSAIVSTQCVTGTYQDQQGQSSCKLADPGYFVPGAGSSSQTPCSPGAFQSNSGSTNCNVTQPGYYANLSGMSQQLECPVDTFSETTNTIQCTPCPDGMTTLGATGVSSIEGCSFPN